MSYALIIIGLLSAGLLFGALDLAAESMRHARNVIRQTEEEGKR